MATNKKISDLTVVSALAAGDYFPVYDASDTSEAKKIAYSSILIDEDDMATDSALRLPSQQSVKAYVDSGTVTMTNKTLTTPTITNPTVSTGTFTSPTINTAISGTAIKDEDDMSSDSATCVPTQQSTKAYVDNNWVSYSAVVPTRSVSDDPTYEIIFAGVDLTDKLSVGMKMKFTQNSSERYFIITKIALDGSDTDVTLYGGTDYNVEDTASYTISDLSYSTHRAPYGFPLNPGLWSVTLTDTTLRDQATPTAATWYNLGSLSIDIPIGIWYVSFSATIRADRGTATGFQLWTSLGTTTSGGKNSELTFHELCDDVKIFSASGYKTTILSLDTKDTYYPIYKVTATSATHLYAVNNAQKLVVRATSVYI